MNNQNIDQQNQLQLSSLSTPPGSILIWLFVLMEILIFVAGFIGTSLFRSKNNIVFNTQSVYFQLSDGVLLTLFLMCSGWLIAQSVHCYYHNEKTKAVWYNRFGVITGLVFLIYKFFDFKNKINEGLTLGKNDFWDLYWLLMGFHYIHVLVGLGLLFFAGLKMKKSFYSNDDFLIRGTAIFWHMCDIAWFFLFPLFYIKAQL